MFIVIVLEILYTGSIYVVDFYAINVTKSYFAIMKRVVKIEKERVMIDCKSYQVMQFIHF